MKVYLRFDALKTYIKQILLFGSSITFNESALETNEKRVIKGKNESRQRRPDASCGFFPSLFSLS